LRVERVTLHPVHAVKKVAREVECGRAGRGGRALKAVPVKGGQPRTPSSEAGGCWAVGLLKWRHLRATTRSLLAPTAQRNP
jgi:hypothetical protein